LRDELHQTTSPRLIFWLNAERLIACADPQNVRTSFLPETVEVTSA
jgi:hypothetical protein